MGKREENRLVGVGIVVLVVTLFGLLAWKGLLDDLGRLVGGWLS